MAILLKDARLIELDPPNVWSGDLRVEGHVIAQVASEIPPDPQDEVVDVGGAIVIPGLVNGHSHLYASLTVGVPGLMESPQGFLQMLEQVWWRLDRALTPESIEMSAIIGAVEALRSGVTTLINHHSSPSVIEGSLDIVARGVRRVGLRGVLCYETTDRNGAAGRIAGIEENRRFAAACRAKKDGRLGGMMGAHASFTLTDEALEEMARTPRLRLHIHLAEDPCDDQLSRARYGASPVERLDAFNLLNADAILVHAIHLSIADLATVQQACATISHNPRSNMHNGVGHAPIHRFGVPVMLGTGGVGSDMLAEARAAWLKARDAGVPIVPRQTLAMLGAGQRTAGRLLGVRLGELREGAEADLVVTDYRPATPLDTASLAGHVLGGLSARHVRHVMVGGEWALLERRVLGVDEVSCRADAQQVAKGLWERMGRFA